jgi:predicted amidohydrolase
LDSVRLAMVQPYTAFGAEARKRNLEAAHGYVAEAAAAGAQIVSFPESFPGDWRAPVEWTPVEALGELAKEFGVYLVGGFTEPLDDEGIRCYNSFALLGPDGKEVGRYRRTTPSHAPWIYKGGKYWDFDWVTSDDLPVFDTDLGRIGILMCSEVYAPELSRAMALKGADLTLLPAGLPGPHSAVYETWRTLVWGRAIENIMFTAVCSNIPIREELDDEGRGAGGLAMICSPEQVLVDSKEAGIHVADLDYVRLRELREEHDRNKLPSEGKQPWATKPGNLRDWRRDAVMQANPVLLTGSPDPQS